MSDKTPFEQWMKNSLEAYQAPYDPSGWEGIEKELDRMEASDNSSRSSKKGKRIKKWSALAAGGAVLIGGAILLYPEGQDPQEEVGKNTQTSRVENVPGSNEVSKKQEAEMEEGTTSSSASKGNKGAGGKKASSPSLGKTEQKNSDRASEPKKRTGEDLGENSSENDLTELKEEKENEKGKAEQSTHERATSVMADDGGQESQLPSEIKIQASTHEGCPPFKVSFSTSKPSPKGVDYFWDLGNGQYSNKAEPTHRYEKAGEYDIKLTLTDRKTGKTLTRTQEGMINVHRPPKGEIVELEERRLRKPRPITAFRLEGVENVKRIVWELGDGTRIEGQERVEHRYPSKGAYSVRAYLKGEAGCRDTLHYTYEQKKSYDLLAPDAFSPNGDGRNDHFIPEALKILDVPFTMTIHDRSGKVVYKTNSAGEPWNGRIQNGGETVSAGSTFLWVVVLENGNGEEESYKGHVTVVK